MAQTLASTPNREIGLPSGGRARELLDDALVWDMTMPWGTAYGEPDVTLPRFKKAGVNVISLTVQNMQGGDMAVAIRHMAKVRSEIKKRSHFVVLCGSVDDILAARAENKLAIIFNHQETIPLAGRIELVQLYYDLGVRHTLLAYNQKNQAADGCAERTDLGLSRFGVKVVQGMNRVGMLVDGTHCGYRTSMEAIEVSTAPFIFSHSNSYAVYPHYRNIRDDQIKACAATGGVIGINGLGEFLDDVEASSESMFKHIDYMVQLVGADHVGIGLDYLRDIDHFWAGVFATAARWPVVNGKPRVATKFAQPEQLLDLTEMMLRRGYSDDDVRGVLGKLLARRSTGLEMSAAMDPKATKLERIARGNPAASDRAIELVAETTAWDMTLPWTPDYVDDETLPRFHRAGVDVISLTIMGPEGLMPETIRHLAKVAVEIRDAAYPMVHAKSIADIRRARVNGQLALIFNLQETLSFEGRLDMIELFYDLGVRHALLAYDARNTVGDGCAERTDGGLSSYGLEVVEEMNRIGMLVDGTHSGYRTTMEAIEASTKPFIFSHCNAHALFPHYRNIRDDQIQACAATGGVIGVNGLGEFLDDDEARSSSIVAHIEHIAGLVGPEHVGLGLDFVRDHQRFWKWVGENDTMWPPVEGRTRNGSKFARPEQVVEIADLLLQRRFSETDVRGILGANFERVAEQVWQ